jgi:hypothetical protein
VLPGVGCSQGPWLSAACVGSLHAGSRVLSSWCLLLFVCPVACSQGVHGAPDRHRLAPQRAAVDTPAAGGRRGCRQQRHRGARHGLC